MPFLYTEADYKNYSGIGFGSIISVVQRHGSFFMVSYGGIVTSGRVHVNNDNNPRNNTVVDYESGKGKKIDAGAYKGLGSNYDASVEVLNGRGWWIDILENLIAEGQATSGPPCDKDKVTKITGKKYYDFCYTDGGNIGIAHFAGGSIRRVIDAMVKQYGEKTVVGWFDGKSINYIKKYVVGCTHEKKLIGKQHRSGVPYINCKAKYTWYFNGVNKFIAEWNAGGDRRKAFVKLQQDVWYDKHVQKALSEMKRCGWPMNMRNAAIALGIINSNGHIGRGKYKWNGDPEAMADKYVRTHRSARHAGGRMAIMDKLYPIKKPVDRKSWTPVTY
jgi:hypothetical protein